MSETTGGGQHAAINSPHHDAFLRPYDLAGLSDALYLPEGISDWTIRGATGKRSDVVIKGAGLGGSVRFGFWIGASRSYPSPRAVRCLRCILSASSRRQAGF